MSLIGVSIDSDHLRPMEYGKAIGERVSALLAERGWTQGQLAMRAHITQPAVWAILKGETKNPGITSLAAIASAFNVTVDSLLPERTAVANGSVGNDILTATEIDLSKRVAALEMRISDLAMLLARFQDTVADLLDDKPKRSGPRVAAPPPPSSESQPISFLSTAPDAKRPRGRK